MKQEHMYNLSLINFVVFLPARSPLWVCCSDYNGSFRFVLSLVGMALKIPHPCCCGAATVHVTLKYMLSFLRGSDLDAGRDLSFDKNKKDIAFPCSVWGCSLPLQITNYNGSFFVGMTLKMPPPVSVRCRGFVRTHSLHSCGNVLGSVPGVSPRAHPAALPF